MCLHGIWVSKATRTPGNLTLLQKFLKIQNTENQLQSWGFLVAPSHVHLREGWSFGHSNLVGGVGKWGGAKKDIREVSPLPVSGWRVGLPAHLEKKERDL